MSEVLRSYYPEPAPELNLTLLLDNLDDSSAYAAPTGVLTPGGSSTSDPMEGYPYPSLYSWTRIIVSSVIVTVIMLVIVLGNGLVVIAIVVDRRLAGLQNWFIASLAVSDLFVGLFIMPLSLANELMGYWVFGKVLCELWLSTDVMLCTASILNLCLISLDRYWSITRAMTYAQQRTRTRAVVMISIVWLTSMIICLPPLVGWKRPQPTKLGYPLCVLSEEPGYVIYSNIGSFYLPLALMISVYLKIYIAARSRARRSLNAPPGHPLTLNSSATRTSASGAHRRKSSSARRAAPYVPPPASGGSSVTTPPQSPSQTPRSLTSKSEEDGDGIELVAPVRQSHDVLTSSGRLCQDVLTSLDDVDDGIELVTPWGNRHEVPKSAEDLGDEGIIDKEGQRSEGCVTLPYNVDKVKECSGVWQNPENETEQTVFFPSSITSPRTYDTFANSIPCTSNIISSNDVTSCQRMTSHDPMSSIKTIKGNGTGAPRHKEQYKQGDKQRDTHTDDRQNASTAGSTHDMSINKHDDKLVGRHVARHFANANEIHRPLLPIKDIVVSLRKEGHGHPSLHTHSSVSKPTAARTTDTDCARRRLARARERRATFVLGVVMASFIGCWLPFFTIYPITLLAGVSISPQLFGIIFWLGYCNSALNPIIYTIFNRDFRLAFHRIIVGRGHCCCCC